METNEIINKVVASGTIEKVVYKLSSYLKATDIQDYIQEMYLAVCELGDDKLQTLYNQGEQALFNYVASMTLYNISNNNSKLARKYGYDLKDKDIYIVSLEDIMRKEVKDGSEEQDTMD